MAPLPRVAAVIYSARELCPALAPAPVSHPAHPHPTSQPCVPPCTLPSLPAPSQPTTHVHILLCTLPRCSALISHPAQSPLHPHIPPHTFLLCPTHSYSTPHTHIPPYTLISVTSNPTPHTPHPALHAPVTPHTFPVPVGAWGQASGVALSCCPLPGLIPWPLASGPWHCWAGDPHPSLSNPPHSTGAPSPGWVSPGWGSPQLPDPGGTLAAVGPFLGCRGWQGRGGAWAPPPGLAFNILFDWFAWLRCRKTFANIPEQPGSA